MNLNEGLNRRSFLKGAALMGGAAAFAGMAGCAPQTSASQELSSTSDSAWDKEVDVVIAGAGGGGLAAAVEASAAGKEVVVCEVMSSATMSNSALCAGMIQSACTKLQKEAGIDDSVEEFDKYLTAVAEGFESPELRRLYAEKSGETIDWLAEQGAALSTDRLSTQGTMVDYYTDVTPAVARMHQNADGIGAGFTEPLRKKAEEQGAEFMFDTQVTRLLTNADGEVEGVVVADGGKEQRIKARLGVILNTGGFSRNADMVRSFMSPAMPGMFSDRPIMGSYGSPWQQGDGIMMACALGAKLVNPWCAYNVAPGLERKVEDNSAGYISMPGIFVSTDGQRHVLENGRPTENVVGDVWKQPNGYVWNIWDQGLADATADFGGPIMYCSDGFEEELSGGYVVKADTVEELAAALDLDTDALKKTIDDFNEGAASGADALGRQNAMPLTQPPFFAGRVIAVSPDTAGGVDVNTNTQVLNVFGEVIPRLYAVGNMVGGFKGKVNAGCGQALGWTYTSGRIAGQHVVTLEPLA